MHGLTGVALPWFRSAALSGFPLACVFLFAAFLFSTLCFRVLAFQVPTVLTSNVVPTIMHSRPHLRTILLYGKSLGMVTQSPIIWNQIMVAFKRFE